MKTINPLDSFLLNDNKPPKWQLILGGSIIIVIVAFSFWLLFNNRSNKYTRSIESNMKEYETTSEKKYAIDDDDDGLSNAEEDAWGTNPNIKDTDGDGYSDFDEINNGYNPLGEGKLLSENQKKAQEALNTNIDLHDINTDRIYIDYLGDYSIQLEPGWEYIRYGGLTSRFEYNYMNHNIILNIISNSTLSNDSINIQKGFSEMSKYASSKKTTYIDGQKGYKYEFSQEAEPGDGSNLYIAIFKSDESNTLKTYQSISISFGYGSLISMKDNADFIKNLEEKIINSFKFLDFNTSELTMYLKDKNEPTISYCPKVTPIYQRDNCYYDLAISNLDMQYCNQIQASELKTECLDKVGLPGNPCITYKNPYQCYIELAVAHKDESFCLKITNSRDNCYSQVAQEKNEPNICKLISSKNLTWDKCFESIAVNTNNADLCGFIETNFFTMTDCYTEVAKQKEDYTICNNINKKKFDTSMNSDNSVATCISLVAKKKQDESICSHIEDEYRREKCIINIAY